jgi:hypothetical protein
MQQAQHKDPSEGVGESIQMTSSKGSEITGGQRWKLELRLNSDFKAFTLEIVGQNLAF